MENARLYVDNDLMRTLHIGEVAFSYYKVQRDAPTEQDYSEWLTLLPELLSSRFSAMGFEEAKNTREFRGYFLELRDREMKKYMQENLSPDDYSHWLESRNRPAIL